ncbi:MAG: hypothetical protein P1U56_26785, partial [Saprospiraceae bacterium]|nr:hypothetical protein [Saprospiraceae bacterium]
TTARNLCKLLVRHYGTFGNKKDHELFKDKYKQISAIIDLEYNCELIYSGLVHEMKRNEISHKLRNSTEEWLKFAEARLFIESADFHYYYYQIKLKLCSNIEYENICFEAINYFEKLYFNHSVFISVFKNKLVQFRLNKGDISLNTLKNLISLREEHLRNSASWNRYTHSLVKIYLNRGEYLEAGKWISIVKGTRTYRNIPKPHRNEWELLGMYKYIMAGEFDEVNIRKIKYNLNYSKTEKSSNNIPFLIGELVYLLKIGENELDRKINHLRNVIKNQCKGNELERGLGFCNAVQKGQKFKAKKSKNSFQNEYVFYEKLLEKV